MPDYKSMQLQIDKCYLDIARELGVALGPVGYAWWMARIAHPEMELWQPDGSHPNPRGTYLAACVFYAVIFAESPEGLDDWAGLSNKEGKLLQQIAAGAVFTDPEQWNLQPLP